MPKRRTNPCLPASASSVSLVSFDAALDILASDTFTRLEALCARFEAAATIQLNEGVLKHRWEEAVKRYWMMKSMEQCCMAMANGTSSRKANVTPVDGGVKMEDGGEADNDPGDAGDGGGRPLPPKTHSGAAVVHDLCEDEEGEWRRWMPKVGDVVLVELAEDGIWPGKIIDKRVFYQGRTVPRGNHFFPVRIYNEDMSPTVTVKSRLIPLSVRPTPPLLAPESLLGAYHHAANPGKFDLLASYRESIAAHSRTHPGVGDEPDRKQIRMEKDAWNKVVNWVMSERRTEKMRALGEERERRLREVAKADDTLEGLGSEEDDGPNGVLGDCCPKKRRVSVTVPLPSADSPGSVKMGTEDGKGSNSRSLSGRSGSPTATIFGPSAASTCSTPRRTASPSIAGFIWPALSTPQRPNSPRRFSEKKRNDIYSGMGEYSPRGRGGTYTPPRILPSGDETATHGANGSSAPSLHTFDFVSPLGPVMFGKLSNGEPGTPTMTRKASLEAVKEDPAEDEEGWTVVQGKRGRRAGSLPCREKTESMNPELEGGEGMDLGT